MLRKIGFWVWCSLFLACWAGQISQATTNCNQSFTFLCAAANQSRVLWIVEDVGGECWCSRLIQVVAKDDYASTTYTRFRDYGSWTWLQESIKHIVQEPVIRLEKQNGAWIIPGTSWRIAVPPPDTTQLRMLQEETFASGEAWNSKYGIEGISAPYVEGLNTKIIYYHPEGLYVDYKISKAYYFRHSRYILVFTNQPRLASGLDTMHGFLLLKIVK